MEVTEDKAPTEAEIRAANGGWLDANPFYLMIVTRQAPQRVVNQDLAESGWIAKLDAAGLFYAPADWYLVRKATNVIVLLMSVHEGERPYYVARHIGIVPTQLNGGLETIAYGIGKRRLDGHTDRLWVMANGGITLGDDVSEIAHRLLMQGLMPDWN